MEPPVPSDVSSLLGVVGTDFAKLALLLGTEVAKEPVREWLGLEDVIVGILIACKLGELFDRAGPSSRPTALPPTVLGNGFVGLGARVLLNA